MATSVSPGMDERRLDVGFGTPFQEQIDGLRKKLKLPTERWTDVQRGAHDRAFVVAGALCADLLADLHAAVISAAAQGRGLQAFRRDFLTIAQKNGWSGWTGDDRAVDPGTGLRQGRGGAGVAWRTKVIYQTNMTQSYWAGRHRQMSDPETLKARPYWRYVHSDRSLEPRADHLAWHGLTLKHDHPFWKTHYPSNGWGCKCRVEAVSQREGEASARAGLGEPPSNWQDINPRTGAPTGIDKGFDHAPGAAADQALRQMVQDKLIVYPPAIAKALAADLNRLVSTSRPPAEFVEKVLSSPPTKEPLWLGFVENPKALGSATSVDTTGFLITLPSDVPRHVKASHEHDGRGQRMAQPADYNLLAEVLNQADSLRPGQPSRHGQDTVVATKRVNGEVFRAVFEVLSGKKNRALALVSLVIKTNE